MSAPGHAARRAPLGSIPQNISPLAGHPLHTSIPLPRTVTLLARPPKNKKTRAQAHAQIWALVDSKVAPLAARFPLLQQLRDASVRWFTRQR